MDKKLIIVVIQIIIILTLVTIITLFIRLNDAIKLEKRISKYSIKYQNDKISLSLVEKIWKRYLKFVKNQRVKMRKLFPSLVKRYDKYVTLGYMKSVDYVTHKFVIAILFILLTIVAMAIQGKIITLFQLFFSFSLGFFILDLILIIEEKINKKKIENDMLRAIIIMNNAFKSGKSTIQAVEIASKKLPKPIGEEFRKLYQELKNSTTVSKMVVKILLVVPIIFVGIIYILNPEYFNPFFESTLGYILLGVIMIMFIIYAYLLRKIIEVNY